jgi:hypothetical protein
MMSSVLRNVSDTQRRVFVYGSLLRRRLTLSSAVSVGGEMEALEHPQLAT